MGGVALLGAGAVGSQVAALLRKHGDELAAIIVREMGKPLAAAEGVSKQEAALRAIREKSARLDRDSEVRRLTRDAVARYGPLLDRLAQ